MTPGIQRLWWLHDALWYQGVARRCGYRAANALNREILRPVAKRAMRKVLADGDRKSKRGEGLGPEAILAHFREASELMWPSLTQWEAEIRSGELEVRVTRCHALEGIRRLGAEALERYECPCTAVRAGWLEALGINEEARQEIRENMKEGAPACRILLRLGDREWRSLKPSG